MQLQNLHFFLNGLDLISLDNKLALSVSETIPSPAEPSITSGNVEVVIQLSNKKKIIRK